VSSVNSGWALKIHLERFTSRIIKTLIALAGKAQRLTKRGIVTKKETLAHNINRERLLLIQAEKSRERQSRATENRLIGRSEWPQA
jgi:hypothetical protein